MKENYTEMIIIAAVLILAMMALYSTGMYLVMVAVDWIYEKSLKRMGE